MKGPGIKDYLEVLSSKKMEANSPMQETAGK